MEISCKELRKFSWVLSFPHGPSFVLSLPQQWAVQGGKLLTHRGGEALPEAAQACVCKSGPALSVAWMALHAGC